MIVPVSSAAILTPVGPILHYVAAKAELESYSRGLALEMALFGIRINTVSPGRTATPGGEATREVGALERGAGPRRRHPHRRIRP